MQANTLLHLSLIQNAGPATIEKLVQALSLEQLDKLYYFSAKDLQALTGISSTLAHCIVSGLQDKKLLEQELTLLERYNVSCTTLYDPGYPALLKNIHLPPVVLYTQGRPLDYTKCVALVGSRKADRYGITIINKLIPELVAAGYTVVSGGALGIDTLAHQATLACAGSTVAVLGSGLLKPYPAANARLFNAIAEQNGTVVSSFSLQCSALAGNFPARNRIIAGLSSACIVIQAAEKSGALITARYALEQGREVGAVPGAIDNPLSAGCHKIISEGAALIASTQDILNLVSDSLPLRSVSLMQPIIKPLQQTIPQTPQEHILLYTQTPISFDELLIKTGLASTDLQDLLFNLQLDGLLEQNFMGLWKKS
ncbi:DNA-protecting protein DprA [Candidatus Dependentiae bacterium]|nr:DNA-protecting protein DprA [Candidatus Dependentiae bacterium]